MKHTLRFVLCAVAWLATALSSSATLQIRISDGTPAGTLVITDQSPDDFNAEVGAVSYTGPVGANWTANFSTGTSKPIIGSAAAPRVDLQSVNVSSALGGSLRIEITDTGFTGAGPATVAIGGNARGQMSFTVYTDNANAQFGKTHVVSALGPFGGGAFAANTIANVNALPPYSITFELNIIHIARGTSGMDGELVVNPPPVCPPDRTLDCNESTDPYVNPSLGVPFYLPQADCLPVVSNYVDSIVGNVITRVWTLTDACAKTNVCTQSITISTNCNPPLTNCVQKAVGGGPCSDSVANHALWLPGIATDFYFVPAGTFVENPDGTGFIAGTVVSASDPSKCFTVDVQLSGRTSIAPPGSPKKDLEDCAYSENGGPVNTSTWYYYTNYTGTLTGCGSLAGAVLTIAPTGPALQVGLGASGKNLHLGLSSWFIWNVTSQPDSGPALAVTGQGDFNLDIVDCVEIPLTNCVQQADGGGKCSDATTHHAVWLPGIGTDFVFTPAPGSFVENLDGTALLTGTIAKSSNPSQGFEVVVNLSGRTSVAPPGSPKKDLKDCAYDEDGGPVDTDTWYYYPTYTGTLTGTGDYAGAVLTIIPTGPAFQVGLGANNKNIKFGASSWFIWTVATQPTVGAALPVTGQGDFNIEIGDCPSLTAPGLGSICGKVKRDCDANGSVSGEEGLEGWTVTLKSGASIIDTDVTDAAGDYCFSNLPDGTYQLVVTPLAGWKQTYDPDGSKDHKHTVEIEDGENKTGKYFGYTGTLPDVHLEVSGPATANCGDTITYSFAVTNTGNTCLYGGIKVNSPLLGGQIFSHTPVAPGEGFVFTKTYVVKAGDSTPLVNTVTIIGDPPGSLANVTKQTAVSTVILGFCPPPAPTGLVDKAGDGFVKLSWKSVSGASSYKVKRSTTSGGPYTLIKSGLTSTSFTDTNVVNGTVYYYVVVSSRYATPSADSDEVSSIPSAGLPSPWKSKDIGPVADAGAASEDAGTFTVVGSGKYIWGTSDEFRYAYQSANGNCTIIARVVGLDDTDGWAKAGVMIRSSLSANAKHASAFITATNGVQFQTRASTGASATQTSVAGIAPAQWLKVVRTGNTFRASYSADGVAWTEFGVETVSMGSSVFIGLAVTSHDDGVLNTAIFDNVTATP